MKLLVKIITSLLTFTLLVIMCLYAYSINSKKEEITVIKETAKACIEKIPAPILSASSSISIIWNTKTDAKEIIFDKNSDAKLPIASVTKLMSIYVARKNGYINTSEKNYEQKIQKILVESNNSEMENLVSANRQRFVSDLNSFASSSKLKNTVFHNPTGLDREGGNISTAKELSKMLQTIYLNDPGIFDITKIKSFIADESSGPREVKTTNQMLSETLPYQIIGGKTGETPLSKQNLVMLYSGHQKDTVIITIVLKSLDRVKDSIKLIKYTNEIYNCRK